jgi:predicted nucleotidyltransferase
MKLAIDIPRDRLADFCRRWKISELAVFGSALRADFGPTSDLDLLVTFTSEAQWSLLDHIQMEEELKTLVGRDVDLITRSAVERSGNRIRREEILRSAVPLHVAGIFSQPLSRPGRARPAAPPRGTPPPDRRA